MNYPLQVGGYGTELHSIVIGGKNYLRLLCISESQQRIIDDINLLESKSIYNSRVGSKLININTIKTYESTIATGLSNGVVSVYKISPNGQGKQTGRFSDHKRTINSLDFIESENQLLSGSQDGTIKLWDLRSSSSKPSITIQASMRSDPIRACQYSPHSSVKNKMCVLSVHDSGALCKFDLRSTGEMVTYIVPKRNGIYIRDQPCLYIFTRKRNTSLQVEGIKGSRYLIMGKVNPIVLLRKIL